MINVEKKTHVISCDNSHKTPTAVMKLTTYLCEEKLLSHFKCHQNDS